MAIKQTILLAFLYLLLASGAEVFAAEGRDLEQKYFANLRCKDQVLRELGSMRATRQWSLPNAREMDGSRRFHTPTEIVGVWVEARIFMNNEALLRRITANFVETRTFDLDSCRLKKTARKSRELFDGPTPTQNSFTDRQLRKLLAENSRGLIYIWSPNMPYSYQQRIDGKSGVEIVKEVAQKLGLKVTVVLDPAASPGYARQIISQYDYMKPEALRSAQSIELALRAMNTHYPALLVYADGKISRHGYPGLGTESEYTRYIRGELSELQK